MINDNKRREVAEELRALDVSDLGDADNVIDTTEESGALFALILHVANDYRPGLHYAMSHFVARDAVELFADLIDPTCHLVGTTSEDGLYGPTIFSHELSCGHACDTAWSEPPAYCYECGARVVRTSDFVASKTDLVPKAYVVSVLSSKYKIPRWLYSNREAAEKKANKYIKEEHNALFDDDSIEWAVVNEVEVMDE